MASAAQDKRLIQEGADNLTHYYNRCRQVSHNLVEKLKAQGSEAQVLRCKGLRTIAPDADQRWHALATQNHWVHFLVLLGGQQVVDLTRRQFFPDCDNPFYQSMQNLDAEWDMITFDALKLSHCFKNADL